MTALVIPSEPGWTVRSWHKAADPDVRLSARYRRGKANISQRSPNKHDL
jgi:hypothetical protein